MRMSEHSEEEKVTTKTLENVQFNPITLKSCNLLFVSLLNSSPFNWQ